MCLGSVCCWKSMPMMLKGDGHKYLAAVTLPFYSDIAQNNPMPLPEERGSIWSSSRTRAWFGRRLICQRSLDFCWGGRRRRESYLLAAVAEFFSMVKGSCHSPCHGPGESHGVGRCRCPQETRHAPPKGSFYEWNEPSTLKCQWSLYIFSHWL